MSTFHGLEMAKRALSVQQAALYTTGHNISNAHTKGYSRQRVDLHTTLPYPAVGKNRPQIPGQIGTGVEVGAVTRVRNEFLDKQFRSENMRAGFWSAQSDALFRLEELLNEPSETGLSHTMNEFWKSLEDLSVNPESGGARAVVAQRGLAFAETFNYLSESLHSIQSDLKQEIDGNIDTVNSLLKQINQINEQLRRIEPHGDLANDLYDKRDVLIDELSEIISINTTYHSTGGGAKEIAQGTVTINLVDENGAPLEPPITLLDGQAEYNDGFFDDFVTISGDGNLAEISFKGHESIELENFVQEARGTLAGLIKSHGYKTEDGVKGHYPEVIHQLNTMAKQMADRFNEVHRLGDDNGQNFFVYDNENEENIAGTITVDENILEDPSLINANTLEEGQGLEEQVNNGENALLLAGVFSEELDALNGLSVEGYLEHMIGIIGVDAQEANRMTENTDILRHQIDEQRMSVSAVSLDEEMTNMLKFQHAYNAAARSMTAIDEMIDRIINNMGLVGR
ncbi:MAG TPA: flagellar hook-associated protein FlgK [Bacillota bacterium]|nr:flagellar hook-associated protein FlgK [Bacillota bacterium]